MAYASPLGHVLVDRELYLPESWTNDRDRCRAAGIGDEVEFATKPRQAMAMLDRALAAGVPFAWFTADEAYGQVKYLRVWLEERDVAYVVATRCNDLLITTEGTQARADELVAGLPARAWRRVSAGAGAHGPREYDWARIPIRIAWARGRGHWLLARRSITNPNQIAYYVCYGPRRPASPTSPGLPEHAGGPKNASNKPRTKPAWTTTRHAPGGPGTPTSPCRCSPTPGSRSPGPWP